MTDNPKDIDDRIIRDLKKKLDYAIGVELKRKEHDKYMDRKFKDYLQDKTFDRYLRLLNNLYGVRKSDIKMTIWELLNYNIFSDFDKITFYTWVIKYSSRAGITEYLDQENFKKLKAKYLRGAIE